MGSQESDIVLIFISSALVAVILASLVAIFVFTYQKRIARQNLKLQQLENDRQHDLLRATIEGQERERKRLATELHDGLGSLLLGIKMHMANQQRNPDLSTQQSVFLAEICHQLERGMVSVRRMSHDLLPATLQTFGLAQAIKEYIEPLQKHTGLKLTFTHPPAFPRFDNEIELALLRVVQELVQNTLKHAEATEAWLSLQLKAEALYLKYEDNGLGLKSQQPTQGLGLKNIHSRVQALNGSFHIDTEKQTGFKAILSLNTKTWNHKA